MYALSFSNKRTNTKPYKKRDTHPIPLSLPIASLGDDRLIPLTFVSGVQCKKKVGESPLTVFLTSGYFIHWTSDILELTVKCSDNCHITDFCHCILWAL